jgi:hypothetical protein
MNSILIAYGLACVASLVGNLGIEAVRLLRAEGAPNWTEPLNWAFTATLSPLVILITAPLWITGRRRASVRH